MDLNATLFGQIITFAIFVWFTMKFIWPQLEQALQQRKQIIADGLAAAEKGQQDLASTKQTVKEQLAKARERANSLVAQAQQQATLIIEQAKDQASIEKANIIASGNKQLQQDVLNAKATLQDQIAGLVIASSGKLLGREINASDHQQLLDKVLEVG